MMRCKPILKCWTCPGATMCVFGAEMVVVFLCCRCNRAYASMARGYWGMGRHSEVYLDSAVGCPAIDDDIRVVVCDNCLEHLA